jgi:hypothetical protein
MMTLQQFRERFAPLVQWPIVVRRATWLEAETLEWSLQYPGVLDASPRAFDSIREEHPEIAGSC